jgi:hypothetical protein
VALCKQCSVTRGRFFVHFYPRKIPWNFMVKRFFETFFRGKYHFSQHCWGEIFPRNFPPNFPRKKSTKNWRKSWRYFAVGKRIPNFIKEIINCQCRQNVVLCICYFWSLFRNFFDHTEATVGF